MSSNDPVIPAAKITRTRSGINLYRRTSFTPSMKKGSLEESIKTYRILEALKNGDTVFISKFLNGSDGSGASTADVSSLLHLAIQVASTHVIENILSSNHPQIDINLTDGDGNTPLHLAAMSGREDVVSMLMSRPDINDTITNLAGKQAVELCRYPELAQAMQVSRAQFVEQVASEMRECFQNNDIKGLEKILSNPRASALLDINGQDPDTGSTVLHDAARARNASMVEFILNHGGDPFRRDRKGKLAIDLCKDDAIKKLLKTASKNQSIVTGHSANEAPQMKGYLKKWTNYTGGYKLRWFVLENGILSYYKHQDDTGTACRGSINMRIATLKLDSSEKQRFEIIGKGSVRYHLRANHPVEANRWVWALTQAIQHAKDVAKLQRQQTNSLMRRDSASTVGVSPSSGFADDSSSRRLSINNGSSTSALASTIAMVSTANTANVSNGGGSSSLPASVSSTIADDDHEIMDYDKDETGDDDDDESQDRPLPQEEPYKEVGRTAYALEMEIKVLQDICASIQDDREEIVAAHPKLADVFDCYEKSLVSLKNLLDELLRQTNERENFFRQRAEAESELRKIWEDNMQKLAEENDVIEEQLHDVVEEKKRTRRALKEAFGDGALSIPGSGNTSPQEEYQLSAIRNTLQESKLSAILSEDDENDEFFDAIESANANASSKDISKTDLEESEGTSEVQSIPETEYNELQLAKKQKIIAEGSFHGYDDPPRTRLRLDEDDRPKISLWGILKSMIGKDMTKMTLPVSFNECTSLLQRVAEDMEYTDLLDKAAMKDDSTLRMIYVAAFAASEYSSTINRIAKPFNPLLGETYEYCRPDKGYRFFVEQVSHHPPVGAAFAEAPLWDYWGESAVKSKFNGRSFDINPLGTWFLTLRPKNGREELYTWKKVTSSVVGIITGSPVVDNYGDMIIQNHTTGDKCVLKFKQRGWLGSGAYEVFGTSMDKNGTPQWSVGGRWNDKIYGRRYQKDTGESLVTLSIENEGNNAAGLKKSNSRKNTPTSASITRSLTMSSNVPFLIWENHPRPPAPFNLTPFAITLNALPEKLSPWIAPTDTRLRPDQRAMEEGEYDFAAKEKNRLEENQRARRKQREASGVAYSPRWFKKSRHPATGDEYWESTGEYWTTREKMGSEALASSQRPEWPKVEQIF
ncbi:Oxysterol-binding protein-domain-containing protein [Dipodascopsis uninucleata]